MTKKKPEHDPYLDREKEKYENPIPSREFIMDLLEAEGRLMNMDQIAEALQLFEEEPLEALRRRLRAMERDGQLVRNRRGEYGLADRMDMVHGRVIGHPDGFGFIVPDEGGEDLFLSGKEMRALFHGDRVMARVTGVDRRGRREGAVVQVLERNTHRVVGRLIREGSLGFVIPENKRLAQDILVPPEEQGEANVGQIVVVELVEQPSKYRQAIGRVVEILGDHMAPGMEIDIAIRANELPLEFPPAVEAEIADLSPEVPDSALGDREDIRSLPLVTIDGEDARDFDDAVYCERRGKGWRLLVAIADVSAYVKPQAALDISAYERGNSVYFPERVIPMLPEILSNGLCSINPKVNRLCMVCEMTVSADGEVESHRFFEGFMRSHARLTYTKVAAMLVDNDPALCAEYSDVLPHLQELYSLYKAFLQRRSQRGAIEFETTETRIVFGAERKIERIIPVVRNDAHRLIEECMVAANVAAAEFLLAAKIPALYRIHEGPRAEKLADLRSFLSEIGLNLGGGDDPTAKDYAKLLKSVEDRPDRHLIQTVLLRSMSQAVYSPDNVGHFGLAYEAYTHFTSPIRRYPDLLVHRAIKHALSGRAPEKFRYGIADMVASGEHCSMTERRADEATRDAVDWLKCEFMMDKVGEVYEGIITGVTGFGIFVELNEIYVEGLVHITSLGNEYFHFDPSKHRLVGEHTRTTFRLADKVQVKVMRVDLDERKIDFELEGPSKPDSAREPREGRGGGKEKKEKGKKERSKVDKGAKDKGEKGDKKPRKKRVRNRSKKAAKKKD